MVTASANGQRTGHVVQVIGSTFDAEFEEGHLPEIYNATRIDADNKGVRLRLTGEVQQHLGGNRVRCVALGSTDGLVRGAVSDRKRRQERGELVQEAEPERLDLNRWVVRSLEYERRSAVEAFLDGAPDPYGSELGVGDGLALSSAGPTSVEGQGLVADHQRAGHRRLRAESEHHCVAGRTVDGNAHRSRIRAIDSSAVRV